MTLPTPIYPDALWDGNEQDTTNDGPADTSLAQAADHNEIAAELQEVQRFSRKGVMRSFRNDTGGTLTKGTLVHVSGHDAGTDLPTVTKSIASGLLTLAEYVVVEDVLNNANGNLSNRMHIIGLDTSAFGTGDPVFLDASTPGTFNDAPPSGVNYGQWCGRVTEVDASTGQVEFTISRPAIPDQVGLEYSTSGGGANSIIALKAGGVTATRLSAAVQDLIPKLATITSEAEGTPGADDIRFTIQAQDVAGNNLAQRCILYVWISLSDFGSPNGAQTTSIDTGTLLAPAGIAVSEGFKVLTDATGLARIIVNVIGIGTRFLMASVNNAEVKSLTETWA